MLNSIMVVLVLVIVLPLIFLKFTFVQEGTAKAILRFGGLRKIIVKWDGHKLADADDETILGEPVSIGDVIPGTDPWSIVGGLRFAGIRFIDTIHNYQFRWRDVQLVRGETRIEFHDPTIDYIFVRPDVYFTDLREAETAPPERIGIDIQFLVTMKVFNPAKALFKAPSNWNENAMARLNASLRSWISKLTLDEVLQIQSSAELIWEGLPATPECPAKPGMSDDPLITTTFKEWGILVEKNGIEIREIRLPPDIQEAAAAEKKQQLISKGFAGETTSRLIAMIADLTGAEYKKVQEEFGGKNPDGTDAPNKATALTDAMLKYKEVINMNQDLIKRRLGLGSGISEIHISSPEGYLASLANILRNGLGGGGGGNPSGGAASGEAGKKEKPRGKEIPIGPSPAYTERNKLKE